MPVVGTARVNAVHAVIYAPEKDVLAIQSRRLNLNTGRVVVPMSRDQATQLFFDQKNLVDAQTPEEKHAAEVRQVFNTSLIAGSQITVFLRQGSTNVTVEGINLVNGEKSSQVISLTGPIPQEAQGDLLNCASHVTSELQQQAKSMRQGDPIRAIINRILR